MAFVMKSKNGKMYETVETFFNYDGIGIYTGVSYKTKDEYEKDYCIDQMNGYDRAVLTCGDCPVCFLPKSAEYYVGRKNRRKSVVDLCRKFAEREITDAVKLLEKTEMEQGENFYDGCETLCLREVNPKDVIGYGIQF